jgi:chemotaxis response regulator CheB
MCQTLVVAAEGASGQVEVGSHKDESHRARATFLRRQRVEQGSQERRDIIVIGGSAGAFEFLRILLALLPADLNAALFVTVHIPADSPSALPHLLTVAGHLPAVHPKDGETIRMGMIYVAPPGA